jgi:hypothetical protein
MGCPSRRGHAVARCPTQYRLERLLTHLADKPLDAIPQAVPDYHQAKAAYRFLANEMDRPVVANGH